jgi:hypothetical protein
MSESKNIFQSMANVYKKVEAIGKDKTNEQQKFKFRGIDDVYNSLHKIFAEEGIFVIPEKLSSTREEIESKSGTKGFSTVSTIRFNFYSSDGSFVSAIIDGEGSDYGDKSTSKSQSMAIKYALLQVFMIPTEDMIDGDKFTIDDMTSGKEFILELETIKSATSIEELQKVYFPLVKKYETDKPKSAKILAEKDVAKARLSK